MAELLAAVDDTRDAIRARLVALVVALFEVGVILAAYFGLMQLLLLPPTAPPTPKLTPAGEKPAFVWLQVRVRCAVAPNLDSLVPMVQAVYPTGKVRVTPHQGKPVLQVGGIVDQKVRPKLQAWAAALDGACLEVKDGQDDRTVLLVPRWTPVPRERLEAAAEAIRATGAKVLRTESDPAPFLLLQSADFPKSSLRREPIRQALDRVGLRGHVVEQAGTDRIDAQTHQAWHREAVLPMVREQRGALAIQAVVWLALAALGLLLMQWRTSALAQPEPRQGLELAVRTGAAVLLGLAVLLLFTRRLGVELRPLRAWVAEPDSFSQGAALAAFGVALPLAHGTVLLGLVLRRLLAVMERKGALLLTAVVFPLVVPLTYHFALWWPVALVAGVAYLATGRLAVALGVLTAVQLGLWLAA